MTDERLEWMISLLLRIGVAAAATVVLVGGIFYLFQHGESTAHYRAFVGEPLNLRAPTGILSSAASFESRGIIQLGLLILILTPVARVLFSVAAFALQRDRLYMVVTLIVLGVLLYNLA